jgi:Polyketide cyclase / dehydrase and lipid transport
MRFDKSIDIDAPQQRVWDVLTAIEAWPERIGTVDAVELLTPAPITKGSRVRLKQPKLPEGTWDITVWDAPSYFEWTQKTGGATSVAGHRVEALGNDRARLTLTLDMRGFLVPIFGRFYRDLTNRYMSLEAEGMKRAAESAPEPDGARGALWVSRFAILSERGHSTNGPGNSTPARSGRAIQDGAVRSPRRNRPLTGSSGFGDAHTSRIVR